MTPLAEALDRMTAAYPRQPFGPVAVRVYAEQLRDLDGNDVLASVNRLLNTSSYMPTIADIRREVAEAALQLPTVEEAWTMALDEDRSNEVVERALKDIGGRWAVRHSNNPETLRAQFRKTYEGRRASAIRNAAVGIPLRPETLIEARKVVSLNGHKLAELPESTRIHPRPVMWRLAQRTAGRILPPPDEATMQDAIAILRDDREGDEDVLYAEAERVLHDADQSR